MPGNDRKEDPLEGEVDDGSLGKIQAEIARVKESCLGKADQGRVLKIYVLGEGFKDKGCLTADCGACSKKCVAPRARRLLRDLLRRLNVVSILPEEMELDNPAIEQEQIFEADEYDFLFLVSTRKARGLNYELGSYTSNANIAERVVLFVPKKYSHFKLDRKIFKFDRVKNKNNPRIDRIISDVASKGGSLLTDAYLKQDIEHGHVYAYENTYHLLFIACRFVGACKKLPREKQVAR
nr:hypothetical protein [Candidatus Sigynarchaeum springense]